VSVRHSVGLLITLLVAACLAPGLLDGSGAEPAVGGEGRFVLEYSANPDIKNRSDNEGAAQCWELPGSKVRGVSVVYGKEDFSVEVVLYEGDVLGDYCYSCEFRMPLVTWSVAICPHLETVNSVVHLNDSEDQWCELPGASVVTEESAVSARIPYSSLPTTVTRYELERARHAFEIQYRQDSRLEVFQFPETAQGGLMSPHGVNRLVSQPVAPHADASFCLPTPFVCGVSLGSFNTWSNTRVTLEELPDEYFEYLAHMGVEWISILPMGGGMLDGLDAQISGLDLDESLLRKLIRKLRDYGFRVCLLPSVWYFKVGDNYVYRANLGAAKVFDWLSYPQEAWPWDPAHPLHDVFVEEFFQSYTTQIVDLAELAEEEDVDLVCIGSETEYLFKTVPLDGEGSEDFQSELLRMVERVREVYSGLVSFELSVSWLIDDRMARNALELWENLDLDVIGLSAYFEMYEASQAEMPALEDFRVRWQRIFDAYLRPLRWRYPDKPILFMELGGVDHPDAYFNHAAGRGSAKMLFDANMNGLDDGEEVQANIYQAFFDTVDANPGILQGLFSWGEQIETREKWEQWLAGVRHHSTRGKLAQRVVCQEYQQRRFSEPLMPFSCEALPSATWLPSGVLTYRPICEPTSGPSLPSLVVDGFSAESIVPVGFWASRTKISGKLDLWLDLEAATSEEGPVMRCELPQHGSTSCTRGFRTPLDASQYNGIEFEVRAQHGIYARVSIDSRDPAVLTSSHTKEATCECITFIPEDRTRIRIPFESFHVDSRLAELCPQANPQVSTDAIAAIHLESLAPEGAIEIFRVAFYCDAEHGCPSQICSSASLVNPDMSVVSIDGFSGGDQGKDDDFGDWVEQRSVGDEWSKRGIVPSDIDGAMAVLCELTQGTDAELIREFDEPLVASPDGGVEILACAEPDMQVQVLLVTYDEAAGPPYWAKTSYSLCPVMLTGEYATIRVPFESFEVQPWLLEEHPDMSESVGVEELYAVRIRPLAQEGTIEIRSLALYQSGPVMVTTPSSGEPTNRPPLCDSDISADPDMSVVSIDGFSGGDQSEDDGFGEWVEQRSVGDEWSKRGIVPSDIDGAMAVLCELTQGTDVELIREFDEPLVAAPDGGVEILACAEPDMQVQVLLVTYDEAAGPPYWAKTSYSLCPVMLTGEYATIRVPFESFEVQPWLLEEHPDMSESVGVEELYAVRIRPLAQEGTIEIRSLALYQPASISEE